MDKKRPGERNAVLMKAVLYDNYGTDKNDSLLYGRREISPETQTQETGMSSSGRLSRQIDHIHSMFENRRREETRKKSGNGSSRSYPFTFLALPEIDMRELLADYPALQPDDDICGEMMLSEGEIREMFRGIPMTVTADEVQKYAGRVFSIGELSFIKDLVSRILAESLLEAGRRSLHECRASASEKIKSTLVQRGFYINILKDRTIPFPERVVLVKKEALEPAVASPVNIYGIPLFMSLPKDGTVNCMHPTLQSGKYVMEQDTVNITSLSGSRCTFFLPCSGKDLDMEDFFSTAASVGAITLSDMSDPGASPLFDLSEDNMAFIASEIYSGEILSKKISRFHINKKYLMEEMAKKISEINDPSNRKEVRISPSAFDPKNPLYVKPRIRHTVIDELIDSLEDDEEYCEEKEREFTGIHGETFSIRTGWLPGENAACNIASVLLADTEKETVLTENSLEVCEDPLAEQIKRAALKIKGRLTTEDESNIEKCLSPDTGNKLDFFKKQFSFSASKMYSHSYKEEQAKFLADPEKYVAEQISADPSNRSEGLLHQRIADKLNEPGYGKDNFEGHTQAETDMIINEFLANGNPHYCRIKGREGVTVYSNDKVDVNGDSLPVGIDWYDFYHNTDLYDYRDIWKSSMPVFYSHLQGRCGTMQAKPGNITWYSLTDFGDASSADVTEYPGSHNRSVLSRKNMKTAPYTKDANFHTLTDRYEFFNTIALRKYAGFAAPFIGPAADSTASYRIEPNLPVDRSTEAFKDSVKENIYMECIGDKREKITVMKSRKFENLADLLREYGWGKDTNKDSDKPTEIQGPAINAAYHSFGPEENGSFLEKDANLNSYGKMDELSDKYFELEAEKFEEFIMAGTHFEHDGLNPLDSAKNGYSKYLCSPKARFELLPKDLKNIPSMDGRYKSALAFENIDKKDRGLSGSTEIKPYDKSRKYYGKFGKDISEENTAAKGHLSMPLGVEPYTEPYGSSRNGELQRPLESLRFTNTLSRNREELEKRNMEDEGPEM